MAEYVSDVKLIACNAHKVFAKLSDLSNVESLKDKIPADAGLKDLTCDKDSISFSVNPVGNVKFKIIEREEPKTIKFAAEGSPIEINMWIQLVEKEESLTKMRLTLKADLPMMVKMMVDGKLKDGINKVADVLANINYEE
ncbi:MAG: SRPBCC family protein [Paludibacteraceae bacterium]|nr:SRPBCC family protein [Paludibacteraceae bacterium]MBP5743138.1 SRPBCC family protein [Paludibacteraceae bacterium]